MIPFNSTPMVKHRNTASIVVPVVVIFIALLLTMMLGISMIIYMKYRRLLLMKNTNSHSSEVAAESSIHHYGNYNKLIILSYYMGFKMAYLYACIILCKSSLILCKALYIYRCSTSVVLICSSMEVEQELLV